MARYPILNYEEVEQRSLYAGAKLFLEQGYGPTTLQKISDRIGFNKAAVLHVYKNKEGLLCRLVEFVLKEQFAAARALLAGVTEDPVLYYAAETTLQLYIAESDEALRDLYCASYSLPECAELIHRKVAEDLLSVTFQQYLPNYTVEDFYRREIASGGIIWGYMSVPCTPDFPLERKVELFLDASLRLFHVPEEKIALSTEFVRQFDFPATAKTAVANMFARLEELPGK